jgi:1-hydroxycarotenoid 3,4-desaturase
MPAVMNDGERMLFILNAPADGDTKTFTTKETGECLDQALDLLSASRTGR